MANTADYLKIAMGLLKNFPAVVLDLKEINVKALSDTTKKMDFEGGMSDIKVTVNIMNKAGCDKKFKVITFITDL